MTGIEIVLIVIGIVFLLGSFMVKDRLLQKDLDQISKLSEDEIRMIIQKKMGDADAKVEESIENKMDDALELSERAMEKILFIKTKLPLLLLVGFLLLRACFLLHSKFLH